MFKKDRIYHIVIILSQLTLHSLKVHLFLIFTPNVPFEELLPLLVGVESLSAIYP